LGRWELRVSGGKKNRVGRRKKGRERLVTGGKETEGGPVRGSGGAVWGKRHVDQGVGQKNRKGVRGEGENILGGGDEKRISINTCSPPLLDSPNLDESKEGEQPKESFRRIKGRKGGGEPPA